MIKNTMYATINKMIAYRAMVDKKLQSAERTISAFTSSQDKALALLIQSQVDARIALNSAQEAELALLVAEQATKLREYTDEGDPVAVAARLASQVKATAEITAAQVRAKPALAASQVALLAVFEVQKLLKAAMPVKKGLATVRSRAKKDNQHDRYSAE